jgi:hypothetical protein
LDWDQCSGAQKPYKSQRKSNFFVNFFEKFNKMVIAAETTNGAIMCNGIRKNLRLQGTIIIKVEDGCTITTKGTTLRGERKSTISVMSTFMKTIESSIVENITIGARNYAPIEPVLNVVDSFFEIAKETEPESFIHHSVYSKRMVLEHTISATVIIIIIIGVYAIWKNWRIWITRCTKTEKPVRKQEVSKPIFGLKVQ